MTDLPQRGVPVPRTARPESDGPVLEVLLGDLDGTGLG